MSAIIVEGVLFVALIAAVGTLLYLIIIYGTPVGDKLRQTQNRRRIDNAAALVCPIHGPHSSMELVRLASGELMCPDCYKETVNG